MAAAGTGTGTGTAAAAGGMPPWLRRLTDAMNAADDAGGGGGGDDDDGDDDDDDDDVDADDADDDAEEEEEEEEEREEEAETTDADAAVARAEAVMRARAEAWRGVDPADRKELGDEATWTLSTAKVGNGAHQLRDGSTSTYWQSDGAHPHWILVQFHRRVAVTEVALYLDHQLDESYTPRRVRVCAGNSPAELEPVAEVELNEPTGWVVIPLGFGSAVVPLRTFCVRISLLQMHQNGMDTHVRLVRVYGPRRCGVHPPAAPPPPLNDVHAAHSAHSAPDTSTRMEDVDAADGDVHLRSASPTTRPSGPATDFAFVSIPHLVSAPFGVR